MLDSYSLLSALQAFLRQRDVEVEGLTADSMVQVMIDWFRLVRLDWAGAAAANDVLVYRYGGWSEGCATGFKFSVLRRITERKAGSADTDWFAGITLMFEPSRYGNLQAVDTVSSDWKSLEAFLHAIESSPAFNALAAVKPMSVMVETGGVR
jgi:hypothetical protein